MGMPTGLRRATLDAGGETVEASVFSIGNPQCVLLGPLPDDERFARLGPALERHPAFPQGTNVEFVEIESSSRVRIRIWERGVGPTESSGTGACASAVAAIAHGGAEPRVEVVSPGGTQLVEWSGDQVFLTGWAELVWEGTWADADAAGSRSRPLRPTRRPRSGSTGAGGRWACPSRPLAGRCSSAAAGAAAAGGTPDGGHHGARRGLLWVTEALPMAVTALLGPVLAVVLQVAPARTALAPFADPIIFLFIGSFMLAEAMFVHGLDRRIAYSALSLRARRRAAPAAHPRSSTAAVATALSMWISNTATTAMMFPIGLSIVRAPDAPRDRAKGAALRARG